MNMNPENSSPIEKAELIKQKLVEKAQEDERKARLARASVVQEELDGEIGGQEIYRQESGKMYTVSTGAKKIIEENKKKRIKLQSEGKQMVKTLRSSPETKDLFKRKEDDSAVRQEVFGKTITELKNIKEETKKTKKIKEEYDNMLQYTMKQETARRDKLLAEFIIKYPEYQSIIEKNSRHEQRKKDLDTLDSKIHSLEVDLKDCLDFQIVFPVSRQQKIKSPTIDEQRAILDKKNIAITHSKEENRKEKDEKNQKGVGFFETKKSFENKITELDKEYDRLKKAYDDLWWRRRAGYDEDGFYELNAIEEKLNNAYYDIKQGLVPEDHGESAELQNFVEKHPILSLKELLNTCHQNIDTYKKTLKLPPDEEVIMELHRKILNG